MTETTATGGALPSIVDMFGDAPMAIAYYGPQGELIVAAGALRHLVSNRLPSIHPDEAVKWDVYGDNGEPLPVNKWPGGRAFRGEIKAGSAYARLHASDGERRMFKYQVFRVDDADGFKGIASFTQEAVGITSADTLVEFKHQVGGQMMSALANAAAPVANNHNADPSVGLQAMAMNQSASGGVKLTAREKLVLTQFAWGRRYKEIAAALGISTKTVEFHRTQGLRKLGLSTREEVVRYAAMHGWFQESA